MKLSYRNRNIILLCIGFMLIGLPVFKMVFKINIDDKIFANIGNGLLMVAVLIFIVGKKKKVEEVKEVVENIEDKHL
ncbi:hypothetical protein [Clostridium lacusfryxellense]|uniref:hypothetical protein n=1 Tax=Clostridium lacusfryxellense TaxID=205328 RepID=UPI001C0C9A79|nr:hypothetical protein [Clostridium lacusfryxellense]MBU3110056.1 hypothetical protein [Clostridium lacusfryxellense]